MPRPVTTTLRVPDPTDVRLPSGAAERAGRRCRAGRHEDRVCPIRGRCLHPHRVMVIGSTRSTLTPRARACHRSAARRPLRRPRSQLRALEQRRRAGRTVPLRRGGRRDTFRSPTGRGVRLAGVPARRATGAALRLSRARPVEPGGRHPLQPGQAPARPLRARNLGRGAVGSGGLRPRAWRSRSRGPSRLGALCAALGARRLELRLGRRCAARTTDVRFDLLRGPRQRASPSCTPACRTNFAAPTPGSHIPLRSPTCSASASPRSSSCRCISSSTTHSSCNVGCATTGATSRSATSPRTTAMRRETAAARWTRFGTWSGHCTPPGSR